MRRKIVISIPTDEEDVRISISPTGKDTVMFTCDSPKFVANANELKEALDEAEKYRLEFEAKEKENEG